MRDLSCLQSCRLCSPSCSHRHEHASLTILPRVDRSLRYCLWISTTLWLSSTMASVSACCITWLIFVRLSGSGFSPCIVFLMILRVFISAVFTTCWTCVFTTPQLVQRSAAGSCLEAQSSIGPSCSPLVAWF